MAESPTPPDRRSRQLALGALIAASLGILIAVLTALGSGGHGGGGTAATTGTTASHGHADPPEHDAGGSRPARPVPILAYKVVNDPPPGAPDPASYVPRAEFAEQMRALDDAGYTAVTLREWWDSWHADGPLPARPVVVSFDDGYHSHLANAYPVLHALDWPGVLNLALENIRSDYGLTEPDVRTLLDAGWELDARALDARAELKERFGVPVDFLASPAGTYDDATLHAAGYLAATTDEQGLAQPSGEDRYALPRVRVDGGVSGAALVTQLAGLSAG